MSKDEVTAGIQSVDVPVFIKKVAEMDETLGGAKPNEPVYFGNLGNLFTVKNSVKRAEDWLTTSIKELQGVAVDSRTTKNALAITYALNEN